MTQEFQPVTLDDMIPHDQALEIYPWLSAQILNRWIQRRQIRSFRGKKGQTIYPKGDLAQALTKDLTCEKNGDQEDFSSIAGNGSAKNQAAPAFTGTGTMTEAAALSEKRSLRLIFPERKKSSSTSSPTPTSQRKTRAKSS